MTEDKQQNTENRPHILCAGGFSYPLAAAAAAIVTATAVAAAIAAAIATAAAASAEQQNQNDNPPAAIEVVSTHSIFSFSM